MTRAEIVAALAEIATLRNSGVASTQFSDRMTAYNQAALERREAELRGQLAALDARLAGRRRQHAAYSTKGF